MRLSDGSISLLFFLASMNDDRFLDRFDFREEYLASRLAKAEKILAVLRWSGVACEDCSVLDIGCGRGQIASRLAHAFATVVGIDLNNENWSPSPQLQFVRADACHLPMDAESFDVVVLNHVIEHVGSPSLLMAETWRVLRWGGVCYLACPNRFSVIEPHYRLPFLSWIPRSLADRYVSLMGKGETYLDNMPSYKELKGLTQRFKMVNATTVLLKDPELFFEKDSRLLQKAKFFSWLPISIIRMLLPILPVWVVILRKEQDLE